MAQIINEYTARNVINQPGMTELILLHRDNIHQLPVPDNCDRRSAMPDNMNTFMRTTISDSLTAGMMAKPAAITVQPINKNEMLPMTANNDVGEIKTD